MHAMNELGQTAHGEHIRKPIPLDGDSAGSRTGEADDMGAGKCVEDVELADENAGMTAERLGKVWHK